VAAGTIRARGAGNSSSRARHRNRFSGMRDKPKSREARKSAGHFRSGRCLAWPPQTAKTAGSPRQTLPFAPPRHRRRAISRVGHPERGRLAIAFGLRRPGRLSFSFRFPRQFARPDLSNQQTPASALLQHGAQGPAALQKKLRARSIPLFFAAQGCASASWVAARNCDPARSSSPVSMGFLGNDQQAAHLCFFEAMAIVGQDHQNRRCGWYYDGRGLSAMVRPCWCAQIVRAALCEGYG